MRYWSCTVLTICIMWMGAYDVLPARCGVGCGRAGSSATRRNSTQSGQRQAGTAQGGVMHACMHKLLTLVHRAALVMHRLAMGC